jgi:hypothetical protein
VFFKQPIFFTYLFLVYFSFITVSNPLKIDSMAAKNLGEFATPNDDYLRSPITQHAIYVANYEIKPYFLTLVQQN